LRAISKPNNKDCQKAFTGKDSVEEKKRFLINVNSAYRRPICDTFFSVQF